MRMRRKKHGAERLGVCREKGVVITSRDELSGDWLPAAVEIGCGKGSFIVGLAKKHPDRKFVALERIADVALLAAERIAAEELANVKLIVTDVKNLADYFGPGEISEIYMNFPDPWPKKGYCKRRLTYKTYLELYKSCLVTGGGLFFKTDNRPLFDFSLEQLAESGFELKNVTFDLHASEYAAENIVTEYETTFSAKGFAINRVEAYLK